MAFGDIQWAESLPRYLTDIDKGRIQGGLAQFDLASREKDKSYEHFYLTINVPEYFMQSDLLHSVPMISWDKEQATYSTGFGPAMLVSNACDITGDNDRQLNKESLFAPIIRLRDYFSALNEDGYSKTKIDSIYSNLKRQQYSNLFYLPPNPIDREEFIVLLDQISWHPSEEIQKKLERIKTERFLSLDYFGFYLFLTKLSFHFCRVPEELPRRS